MFLIFFAAYVRLLPHPPNVAPISALALFGAVYLPKKYAFIMPVTALFLSDLLIGFYGITMVFVYGSFLLTGILGLWLKNHKNILTIFSVSLISSSLFFVITNFGVWVSPTSWYSRDFQGLINCYIAAIPFFKNTLMGDLFYVSLFFGIYELGYIAAKSRLGKKQFSWLFSEKL